MIISHKHRLIFIHCRKAAGSSIVVSLSRYLGDEDIQISAIPDTGLCGLKPPKRMVNLGLAELTIRQRLRLLYSRNRYQVISENVKKEFRKCLSSTPQHSEATDIRSCFPSEWSSYKKFCVVRNPWTKTFSDYLWRTRKLKRPPTFKEYVLALQSGNNLNGIVPKNHNNWNMYTIEDQVVVDYAVNFDTLASDLGGVLNACGIRWDGWLPKVKQSGQPPKENHVFDADTVAAIGDLYEREISHFNFKFDGKI